MKNIGKKIAAVFAAATIASMSFTAALPVSAAQKSESELKAAASAASQYQLSEWLYADFDGNGTSELFAICADESGSNLSVEGFFVDSNAAVTKLEGVGLTTWSTLTEMSLSGGKSAAVIKSSNHGMKFSDVLGVDGSSYFEYNISADKTYGDVEKSGDSYKWVVCNDASEQVGTTKYTFDSSKNTFNLISAQGQITQFYIYYSPLYDGSESGESKM